MNIKSVEIGLARQEFEYEISYIDGEALLALYSGPLVEKTRYSVPHGNHMWEIDVFEGDNAGLIVAEVELNMVGELFDMPDWAGQEVTDDIRYYNTSLSKTPDKDWKLD